MWIFKPLEIHLSDVRSYCYKVYTHNRRHHSRKTSLLGVIIFSPTNCALPLFRSKILRVRVLKHLYYSHPQAALNRHQALCVDV